jgi:hypothetical protein
VFVTGGGRGVEVMDESEGFLAASFLFEGDLEGGVGYCWAATFIAVFNLGDLAP